MKRVLATWSDGPRLTMFAEKFLNCEQLDGKTEVLKNHPAMRSVLRFYLLNIKPITNLITQKHDKKLFQNSGPQPGKE